MSMTTTTIYKVLVTLSAAGAAATVPTDELWGKVVAGGGAAALVAGLFVWVTKFNADQGKERDRVFAEAVKEGHAAHARSTEEFAATVREIHEKAAASTEALLRDTRAECAAREDKLIQVLREARTK